MADSTTHLDTISSTQAAKEVTANALFDAGSPSTLFGRRGPATSGLTWAWYGGRYRKPDGETVSLSNDSLTLTADATNYLEADLDTGAVSANTTAFTAGLLPLYAVVTGASTVTSYTDHRAFNLHPPGAEGNVAANTVRAGPESGADAGPTYRALVFDDLPAGTPGRPRITTVTYAAEMTADFSAADTVRITLDGDATITLAGAQDGQRCLLELTQDATGGRTVTWSANVRYGSDITGITLSAAGGALDRIGFIHHSATGKYDAVALARGY